MSSPELAEKQEKKVEPVGPVAAKSDKQMVSVSENHPEAQKQAATDKVMFEVNSARKPFSVLSVLVRHLVKHKPRWRERTLINSAL